MTTIFLMIALTIAGQNPLKPSGLDLSGSWRDDLHNQAWRISQDGSDVTMVIVASGLIFHGKVVKEVVKYTEWTVLTEASSKACEPYVGQKFEFPSQLRI